MDELTNIGKIRKKLGFTQLELARQAGVSQSLIAKIESHRIDPSYSNAKKILQVLHDLEKKDEVKAIDIMNKKIISVEPDMSLRDAIRLMRKNNISQMPVLKGNKIVGFISESILLNELLEGEKNTVEEIMKENPPVIPPNTSKDALAGLLKYFPLVLIEKKGQLLGIVTKADLLKVLYS